MDGSGCRPTAGSGPHARTQFFLEGYNFGKTLGVGSFGTVKLAEHVLTGSKVAIKIMSKKKIAAKNMEEKVRRGAKIMRSLVHPYIIKLYEVIETHTHIFLVMEYAESGELFDYIVEKGHLSEDESRHFFQQIISAVEYCHGNMVVHRDLKPENLLLDSQFNVKIADFGSSNVVFDGHFLKTSCGSRNYSAPEVIFDQLYVGPEVDVWSCGVVLYFLLCGEFPFDDENIPQFLQKIKVGIHTFPNHVSREARDLISQILIGDPLKRSTISKIKRHPWFQFNLPLYIVVHPLHTSQHGERIDEDIVKEVAKMGFNRNQDINSLKNGRQNKAALAYQLVLDNYHHISGDYFESDFQEFSEGRSQVRFISMMGPYNLHNMYENPIDHLREIPWIQVEKKWTLSLQSGACPKDIIVEVLKVLQGLGVRWKKMGRYNMKCCWFPPSHVARRENFSPLHHIFDSPMPLTFLHCNHLSDDEVKRDEQNVVKFELQLYRTDMEKYVLDLQRTQGPYFIFLDLCASFLSQLRVI